MKIYNSAEGKMVMIKDIPKEIKKQFGNMDNINMVIKWFESMR